MMSAKGQSVIASAVEAVANVVVGYVVALGAQLVILPVFGVEAGLGQHLGIAAAFSVVSVLRSFVLRRAFEAFRRVS